MRSLPYLGVDLALLSLGKDGITQRRAQGDGSLADETPPDVVGVPRIQPDRWEDFPVFRETFLSDVYEAHEVELFRRLGKLGALLVAERGQPWPYTYMDATARYLQAALADLRYLKGFLQFACGRDDDRREGDRLQHGNEEAVRKHDRLCELGNLVAAEIGVLADELEKEVGAWRFDQP